MNTEQVVNGIVIEKLLKWGAPKEVKTRNGLRILRKADPTPEFEAFWADWQTRNSLYKAGISVGEKWKQPGVKEVCWWQNPQTASAASEPSPAVTTTVAFQAPQPPANPSTYPITKTEMKWSDEQQNIFFWFQNKDGKYTQNLIVRARAGTGKTTTIKQAFSFATVERMLYAVFGKRNQLEAQEKISDPRVDIKTLHALGFFYIQQVWPGVKPTNEVEVARLESIFGELPGEVTGAILRLVGFGKNLLIEPSIDALVEIAEERTIECLNYEDEDAGGWKVAKIAEAAMKVMNAAKKKDPEGRISFNDMVWLPMAMNWVTPMYDLVVVDEAQDMNMPQLMMAMKACKSGGRICVVGDDRQAIYAFRGAVQNGLDMMKDRLNAIEMGLTVTYRCPKKVVALASAMVPDYKAADAAPEGIIDYAGETAMLNALQVGDACLSRINAPLMGYCLGLIKRGVPARIEGKDIGKQLIGIVKKLNAKSIPHFIEKVNKWGTKMKKRLIGTKHAEEKMETVDDQVETLLAIAEGAASVREIETRINNIFEDTYKANGEKAKPAVVFSSVHKAKGLEWDRVFVLKQTFFRKGKGKAKPTPEQKLEEENIYYVAITRTKKQLVFVGGGADLPSVTSPATATTTTK